VVRRRQKERLDDVVAYQGYCFDRPRSNCRTSKRNDRANMYKGGGVRHCLQSFQALSLQTKTPEFLSFEGNFKFWILEYHVIVPQRIEAPLSISISHSGN
jgi:hypothetical protein